MRTEVARLSRAARLTRLAVALVAASALCLVPAVARADTPIEFFTDIPSTTQAGGHPDVEIHFGVTNRFLQVSTDPCDCQDAKDSTVHFPTGFIGNPHAAPQCSMAQFSTNNCPIDSQVGIVSANVTARIGGDIPFDSAVYNLIPPPGVSGLSGFKVFLIDSPQFLDLSARTGSDYGLDATAVSLYHGSFPLHTFREELWGVPADPSHNLLRTNKNETLGETAYLGTLCDGSGALSTEDPETIVKPCETNFNDLAPIPSNSPATPFLQNPTTCEGPLSSTLEVLSYDGGITTQEAAWPQMTGCDQLSFNPSLYVQPTTSTTDAPSGIDVDLSVPQQVSPEIPSPTELKATTVTLPEGFSINPGAADGKTACTDAEARFGTPEEAQCPDFAKVGSLTIESSALPGPLPGSIYLGQPEPGNRYRIFLVADGFAVHIKLPGTVTADPSSGRLTVSFQDLPQSPLTAFNMHFFGSERGLLATPTQCGTYPVTTTFTPWDETIGTQTSTQFFTLSSGPDGSPCPNGQRPFHPAFAASAVSDTAGAHTPFSLEMTRPDGDQNLSSLNVMTPPGFSASLAGVSYCPDASLAAAARSGYSGLLEESSPSCPASSQIGTAVTGAGAGTHPLNTPGKVYLAGPYEGAPLSLAVITPAVSGPYDLGNVVVRAALHVNQSTAQITAVSDPLPQILEGIPLRLRSIRVNLDRPDFTLNPTNCDSLKTVATAFGSEGAQATLSVPFQVANCTALPFAPKLDLKLSGDTKRVGSPALTATLRTAGHEANVASTAVSLPRSELVDNAHIGNPCTRVEFSGTGCPASSVIGSARAVTPLLEQPLQGPVYLMTGFGHKLPDVVADLKGQIEVVLDGEVQSVQGRVRTTFHTVPDAPISSFVLKLDGGKKGLLENRSNLCGGKGRYGVLIRLTGQNNLVDSRNQELSTPCSGAPAKRQRRGHRKAAR